MVVIDSLQVLINIALGTLHTLEIHGVGNPRGPVSGSRPSLLKFQP